MLKWRVAAALRCATDVPAVLRAALNRRMRRKAETVQIFQFLPNVLGQHTARGLDKVHTDTGTAL